MKAMKKVFSLVLSFVLMLSLVLTSFAASETKKVTIYNEEAGHTYQAYQIFDGDLYDGKLSNVTWGSGVNTASDVPGVFDQATGKLTVNGQAKTAAEWAEALGKESNNSTLVKAFADAVSKILSTSPTGTTSEQKTNLGTDTNRKGYVIDNLDPGYYLVKDADGSLAGADDALTRFILAVVGDVEVDPKSSTPSVDKQVFDVNDSSAAAGTWNETADHDIGDKVGFRLIGTLPDTYDDYKSYKYIFHDELSEGLTLDASTITVKVVTGNDPYTEVSTITLNKGSDYTIVEKPATGDGCSFHVVFKDLKKIEGLTKDHKILVEYKATLNENAKIGKEGNPNDVKLEFSNNPNYDGDGDDEPTGETPKDRVIVFTYELDVDKVKDTENGEALNGAGFTLSKKNDQGTYVPVKFKKVGNKYVVDPEGDITEIKGVDFSHFQFVGLDDGDYKLEETTVPNSYNKADDIYFTITATHNDTNETLESVDFGNKITAGKNDDVGKGTTKVVNKSGATLPSSGGIGTTIFYIVGGVLVVFAGVLLITKRRMKSED